MAIDNALEKIRNITNEEDGKLLSTLIQAGGLLIFQRSKRELGRQYVRFAMS